MKRTGIASPEAEEKLDYEQFLCSNRRRVNQSLNRVLWICILAGPAIAVGVFFGVFKQTSYSACVIISVAMLIMAGGNLLILKRNPDSFVPGFWLWQSWSCSCVT